MGPAVRPDIFFQANNNCVTSAGRDTVVGTDLLQNLAFKRYFVWISERVV